ncbi:MAG: hypothetical protein QJR08_00220 [Bacillota bacterium]|nr:hypothetical protein [Bacillota bacterium]
MEAAVAASLPPPGSRVRVILAPAGGPGGRHARESAGVVARLYPHGFTVQADSGVMEWVGYADIVCSQARIELAGEPAGARKKR